MKLWGDQKGEWFFEKLAEKESPPRFKQPHHCCPFCHKEIGGGMTLVRHLFDAHKINYELGNKLVDLVYSVANKEGWPKEFVDVLGYDEFHEPVDVSPEKQAFLDQLSQEIDRILAPTLQQTSGVVESGDGSP